MKPTEAKISKGEIDLFKRIQAEPDGELGKSENLRKRKVKAKRKVQAKDHPALRGALDQLNGHGAKGGDAAFGAGSNDAEDPPPNSAVNQREVRAKQRLIAEQSKKGYGCGTDAGVDELRKVHQRGPSGRLA